MRNFSLEQDTVLAEQNSPSLTYAMKESTVEGTVDGIDAIQQAVYKILNTERFEYPVYSFSYGVELKKLIGRERAYVRAELKRIVTEALLRDNRIKAVADFDFIFEGDVCRCSFAVESTQGTVTGSVEVNV